MAGSKYKKMADEMFGSKGSMTKRAINKFGTDGFTSNSARKFAQQPLGSRVGFWANAYEEYQRRLEEERRRKEEEKKKKQEAEKKAREKAKEEREKAEKKAKEKQILENEKRKHDEAVGKKGAAKQKVIDAERSWFEKMFGLDRKGEQGFLQSAGELLGKAGDAVQNPIADYYRQREKHKKSPAERKKAVKVAKKKFEGRLAVRPGEKKTAVESAKYNYSPWDYLTDKGISGIWDQVAGGFTGKKRTDYGKDIAQPMLGKKEYKKLSKSGKILADIGGELFTDPTTFVGPVGVGKAATKGAYKAGMKVAPNTTLNIADKYIDVAGKVADSKIVRAGDKALDKLRWRSKYNRFGQKTDLVERIERQNTAMFDGLQEEALQRTANILNDAPGKFKDKLALGDDVGRLLESPLKNKPMADVTGNLPYSVLSKEAIENLSEEAVKSQGFEKAVQLLQSGKTESEVMDALAKDPTVQKMAQELAGQFGDIRKMADSWGIPIADKAGYMPHVLTQEAKEYLKKRGAGQGGTVRGDKLLPNEQAVKRKYDLPAEEFNKRMIDETGGEVPKWFEENAFQAAVQGNQRTLKYLQSAKLVKELFSHDELVVPVSKIPKSGFNMQKEGLKRVDLGTYKHLPEELRESLSKVAGGTDFYVAKGVDQALQNVGRLLNDETGFLGAYDKINRLFKKTATFSGGFHFNNIVGAMFNQGMAGMSVHQIPIQWASALKVMERAKNAARKPKEQWTKQEAAAVRIYDSFSNQGLKQSGQMKAEFTRPGMSDSVDEVVKELRHRTKGAWGRAVDPLLDIGRESVSSKNLLKGGTRAANAMFEASRKVGDQADEISRLATFMWKRNTGASAEEAADFTRMVLFDYNEITNFEKVWVRRVMPFYTFMRKNAVFQLTAFAKNPQRYGNVAKVGDITARNMGIDISNLPDYMQDQLPLPIPDEMVPDAIFGEGDHVFHFQNPAEILPKMLEGDYMELAKELFGQVTPVAKNPIEALFNVDTFMSDPETGEIANLDNGKDANLYLPGFDDPVAQINPRAKRLFLDFFLPIQRYNQGRDMERGINPYSQEKYKKGEKPSKARAGLATAGLNVLKKWDQKKWDRTRTYRDIEHVKGFNQDLKRKGVEVPTLNELKKEGKLYGKVGSQMDKEFESSRKKFQKLGLNKGEIKQMLDLKKMAYNKDEKQISYFIEDMEAEGIPPELIEEITRHHLKVKKHLPKDLRYLMES